MTPSYALLPDDGIRHIAALNPNVKIIFLIRDPIDRAIAHLQMLYERRTYRREPLSPLDALTEDPRFEARSRYSETLRRYRRHFAEEAMWIGDFDRIGDAPEAVLRNICEFLGVRFDEEVFPDRRRRVNVSVPRDMGNAAYSYLRDALKPEYDELEQVIPDAAVRWKARHYGGAA